jgi:ribosome-binding factor A
MTSRSRRGRAAAPSDSRTRQLCSEASEALSLALAAADDPRLADATLVEVRPDPDASRLHALLTAPAAELEDVRAAAAEARAYLRREVAFAVNRKRAPELAVTVVARASGGVPEDDEDGV